MSQPVEHVEANDASDEALTAASQGEQELERGRHGGAVAALSLAEQVLNETQEQLTLAQQTVAAAEADLERVKEIVQRIESRLT